MHGFSVNIIIAITADVKMKLCLRLQNQVDELVRDVDDFDDLHALHLTLDLVELQRRVDDGLLVAVLGDGDGALELAEHLHGHGNSRVNRLGLVIRRPVALAAHLAVLGGKAEPLPELLDDVRRKRAEQEQQLLHVALRAAVGGKLVDHGHHGRDGGVHLQFVDILRDLLDGLVDDRLVLVRDGRIVRAALGQIPDTVEEALRALDGLVGPGDGLLKIADEHDVQAHGVRAVLIDDVVGIDDVAARLGHFFAALAEDHAMARALLIRLLGRHDADIIQELVPETAVEQVERGVLHAAVVPVDGTPVVQRLFGSERFVIVRIHVAQEIPARAGPLRHGVGLALGRAAALRAGGVDPVGHLGDGALAVVGRLVALDLRQNERQLLLGNGHPAARRAVDQRNGLAPIALAGEHPVTQLVVDLLMAPALLDGIPLHRGDSLLDGHAVEEAGVDHDARIVLEREGLLGDVAALDDLDDGDMERGGEVPVALVVARNAHEQALETFSKRSVCEPSLVTCVLRTITSSFSKTEYIRSTDRPSTKSLQVITSVCTSSSFPNDAGRPSKRGLPFVMTWEK